MALAAGDSVITAASVSAFGQHRTRPLAGKCESTGPAVIVWADGSTTSYATVGAAGTSVLFAITTPTHASLIGSVVSIVTAPNPGSRVQGVVVGHWNLTDPAGTPTIEAVIVKTDIGYLPVAYAAVTVLATA